MIRSTFLEIIIIGYKTLILYTRLRIKLKLGNLTTLTFMVGNLTCSYRSALSIIT
jgi:hypothetical protein